ncbi:hypothetical protein QNC13_003151 [Salmonella enterica]|nr:hypothetical protein [Salmonella enterica]EHB3750474.1 hypothetical protein [Salmonella enterica subsp. enterica serovar Newport]EHM9697376.1 hypothetical protein [Salmonella enterica subsp. enterica serovar 4,[5],12,[27]:-:1,2]EIQ8263740.1 hypothetical protein [Salmonella enterica subsp. enterica serovar Bareilly]HCS9252622.1 hypothetical protein [Salmonella enterica subsp. enterica serovar Java]HDN5935953.1 hypothetical protein [Salmonella enterica subsp. enterica serovar Anatum]HDO50133
MEVDDVVTIVRDGFWHTLPPLVAGLSDQPLYIAVAMWGKLSGTLLTTETVSRTFSLPQGRARDVIHYIAHEGRSYVTSERLTLYVDGSVSPRRRALKIRHVEKIPPGTLRATRSRNRIVARPRTDRIPPENPAECPTQLELLRRWMCRRRVGDVWVPENET